MKTGKHPCEQSAWFKNTDFIYVGYPGAFLLTSLTAQDLLVFIPDE